MNDSRSGSTLTITLGEKESGVTLRSSRGNGEKWGYFKDMRLYNLPDVTVLYFMAYKTPLI